MSLPDRLDSDGRVSAQPGCQPAAGPRHATQPRLVEAGLELVGDQQDWVFVGGKGFAHITALKGIIRWVPLPPYNIIQKISASRARDIYKLNACQSGPFVRGD